MSKVLFVPPETFESAKDSRKAVVAYYQQTLVDAQLDHLLLHPFLVVASTQASLEYAKPWQVYDDREVLFWLTGHIPPIDE